MSAAPAPSTGPPAVSTTTLTHCPYCSLQCGIELTAGARPATLQPQLDFPTNLGGLCSKGWTATELLDHPERLLTPLVREQPGDRTSALRPATWDEALARVVAAIRSAQADHGRDAVGCFGGGGLTNEKAYQFGKFARVALRTSAIDYNGRWCMSSAAAAATSMLGIDRGLPFPLADIAEAQAILLVGSNAAETMPPAMQFFDAGRAPTSPWPMACCTWRSATATWTGPTSIRAGAEEAKSKMALVSLLRLIWPQEYVDEPDAKFINDRVHANIQRDGTFSVVPQMKGGVTSVEQLRAIADVAEKYQVPMIKLTGGQRIDLLGIPKEDLPKVWADLGMPSGYAYGKSFRTVKTCVGQEFCRFGLGDSTALGIALEGRFQGIEGPGKMKLAVSGCPRNCAEALVKDVGVVAVEAARWEIYVGGAAGAHIRKGDLLTTVEDPDEVITLTGRFLQYHRENANWLERTYAFVPRVGIEVVRSVVVDDVQGISADLDARMEQSVQAYRDPWLDGAEPASPGQFRSATPLRRLPLVPVRDGSTSVSGGGA